MSGPKGYRITVDGRVFSIAHNWRGYGEREMVPDLNADGYPSVRLTINGQRRRLAVHRLVAAHYLPPRPSPDHEVCHIDGNKTNNHARNLRWGTSKDNASDRERHGRTSRGIKHSEAVRAAIPHALSPVTRAQISDLAALGKTQREIAALLQCSQSAVGAVIRGRS